MATDLNIKVAHLVRDFSAVRLLAEFIEHELEKRVVARLGLIKIEALNTVAGAYKNEIKRKATPDKAGAIKDLENLLTRLRVDVEGGIRDARNAQVGHSLGLPVERIPEHWLFMGHSTFAILEQDLGAIDAALRTLDSGYLGAQSIPALDSKLRDFWSAPKALGPANAIRTALVYAGPWTPDVVSLMPGGTAFQDASLRVIGLRLMLRQLGFLILPFWQAGGPVSVWERLLLELSIIDFFALEEAVFDGNVRGGTPSLVAEWSAGKPPHKGVAALQAARAGLSAGRIGWRDNVRNKVCAHMDPDVPASMLDVANWLLAPADLFAEIERLCGMVGSTARLDARTKYLTGPTLTCGSAQQIAGPRAPRWQDV